MKTCDEIRVDNLRSLIEEYGSIVKFSEHVGKDSGQVSQWLNRAKDWKSGKPRKMTDDMARHIEERCGKERGWMDHDHSDPALELFMKMSAELRAQAIRASNPVIEPTRAKAGGSQ